MFLAHAMMQKFVREMNKMSFAFDIFASPFPLHIVHDGDDLCRWSFNYYHKRIEYFIMIDVAHYCLHKTPLVVVQSFLGMFHIFLETDIARPIISRYCLIRNSVLNKSNISFFVERQTRVLFISKKGLSCFDVPWALWLMKFSSFPFHWKA